MVRFFNAAMSSLAGKCSDSIKILPRLKLTNWKHALGVRQFLSSTLSQYSTISVQHYLSTALSQYSTLSTVLSQYSTISVKQCLSRACWKMFLQVWRFKVETNFRKGEI